MKSIQVNGEAQQGWGHVLALDPRYEPMIARLEQSAERHAAAYRRRVVLAGLLGYAVLFGMIALLAGLTVSMILLMIVARAGFAAEAKLAILFGLLTWALVRALWVPPPPPDGVAVKAEDALALFAMIDRVRAATGGPAMDAVRITDQMNAAVTQEGRALFLGTRNTLYLGLPLLCAMTTREVEAIVAHEFGHFVGRHGHSAAFAYRVRQRWMQAADRLPDGVIAGLLRRFFGWYGPWFASYSFVLARRQEYEADRVAAEAVGSQVAADALVRVTTQTDRFADAWSIIWRQAPLWDDPPASPFRTLAAGLAGADPDDDRALRQALERSPDLQDTHPTLAQRLAALDGQAALPPPLDDASAVHLLGDSLDSMFNHFDAQWHEWADAAWAQDRAQRLADEAEKATLAAQIAQGDDSRESLYRHAWLIEATDTAEEAAKAYATVLDRYPEATDARFRRGDMLLDMGDDGGMALLLEAAREEPSFLPYAYRHIVEYLHRHGRTDDAAPYIPLLEEAETKAELAKAEANAVDESVSLRPLTAELQERLTGLAQEVPGVASLHAALRDMRHAPEPQILFLFSPAKGYSGTELLDSLIDALLPAGDLMGIERSAKRRWLFNRVKALPQSRII
ncbi:M48 family metalloprotease [Sphingobium ummariense]